MRFARAAGRTTARAFCLRRRPGAVCNYMLACPW
nr:MAG TPA: hypothetical protein [Caudoviricetes sp.]